jgi:hypothetical protein
MGLSGLHDGTDLVWLYIGVTQLLHHFDRAINVPGPKLLHHSPIEGAFRLEAGEPPGQQASFLSLFVLAGNFQAQTQAHAADAMRPIRHSREGARLGISLAAERTFPRRRNDEASFWRVGVASGHRADQRLTTHCDTDLAHEVLIGLGLGDLARGRELGRGVRARPPRLDSDLGDLDALGELPALGLLALQAQLDGVSAPRCARGAG